MTKRFRMIAGPNGSGKSTLANLLRRDYAVNFYTMLNADDNDYLTGLESGGHSVPEEKVVARSIRALGNVGAALPFCSRAFFFDNSMLEMRFLAEYTNGSGFVSVSDNLPSWFETYVHNRF